MSSARHKVLKIVRDDFDHDLRPKYVLPYMVNKKIVTEKEKQEILSLGSLKEQNEKFFDVLSKMSFENFKIFLEVLSEDSGDVNYPWLAEKFNSIDLNQCGDVKHLDNKVDELLVRGGVPFRTNCFLPREEKIQAIRKALYSAKGKRCWIVLYGMTGTGKSVVATEALRDNDLINSCFSDGVFWVSVGNIRENSNLSLRIRKLFKLLNCEDKFISSSEDLSELTFELKKIVVSKKMLVVLDDVWTHQTIDVLSVFDIGCPILVTTKYQSVFKNFRHNCIPIEYKNDFSISEGRDLLALHLSCDSKDLPDEVDWICKKCRGSPFTLSHIGRWMSSHGNVKKHWQNLKEKLEKEGPLRQRHLSGEESNGIKKIILSTVEPIEDYKDYFYDFVIFPEDIWVPSQVFEVLWDKDSLETDRTLHSLYQASLVQYEKEPSDNYAYGIHDIYLEILSELCSTDQDITNIETRHERLINNYLKMCLTKDENLDFSLLPKDNYIHYYLAYHIEKSGVSEFFHGITIDDIFFDLQFIQTKVHLDPGDLYSDYIRYGNLFKDKQRLEEFIQFASKVKNTVLNYKDWDIIQWGLFEPPHSFVYEKALALVSHSCDNVYFDWCNKCENLSQQTSRLNLFEKMYYAAISPNCQLIACVGDDCKVKIFASMSGTELKVFTGHTATVNLCDFNASGSKLATASDDQTVKVFEIDIPISAFDLKPARKRSSAPDLNFNVNSKDQDMSLVTFRHHPASVLCCRYSPDEELIISSDRFGCVYVWQSSTGAIKFRVLHNEGKHIHEVNYCCFDPSKKLFATSAYDTVKLWSLSDAAKIKEIQHDEQQVMGICFSGEYLISVADKFVHKNSVLNSDHSKVGAKKNLLLTSCSASPDGNFVACGTSDCTVLVYNLNTGKQVSNLKGHRNNVLCVSYSMDGNKLLSASEERYILHNVSDIYNASSLIDFEEHLSVRQLDDSLVIAASNSSNCIEIRKGMSGELYCKTDPDEWNITACSLSNDCTELVYGTKSGSLKVFTIENRNVQVLTAHTDQINYIIHSKNNLFFTCSVDKTIILWIDKLPHVLKGHRDSVVMCVPFRRRNHLLSCSKDGTLRVWDIDQKGPSIVQTEGHGNQDVRYCDLSFDETYMASASADKSIQIYLTLNGSFYKRLDIKSEVKCCRFSPKFLFLVAGCDSGKVVCSQLNDKHEPFYHQSCVSNILFTEDGLQYLTIADDIKILRVDKTSPQTVTLPTSSLEISNPSIWASGNFDILVVIHGSVLYILKKLKAAGNN